MAQSFVQYTGDGTTRVFGVPFKYLDRSHVKIMVAGTNKSFDWLSSNSIRMTAIPTAGKLIDIRRYTPNDKPLVDFSDGSTITEEDLDKLAYQNVFLNQEAIDLYTEVNGTADGLVGLVQQALNSSATSEANSVTALTKATNAENTVLNTGSAVNVAAAQTALDAYNTHQDMLAASTASNTAVSNAAVATTKASIATTAAASAEYFAGIAQLAANFNPNDFYTKVQMDGILQTNQFEIAQVTGLAAAIAGKAEAAHIHTVAQVSGLQAILDGKLASGGTALAAQKWSTSRTFTLTGDVTGSVSIDGSANVSITTVVADDSHAHTMATVTGLTAALAGKAAAAHTHVIADTTNLQASLDAKVDMTSNQAIGGQKTFTKPVQVKAGAAAPTVVYNAFEHMPTDYGAAGKPMFFVQKALSATQYNVGLWDTVNNNGVINYQVSSLQWNGQDLATAGWVATQLALKQNSLGFTPVQQGGPVTTGSNKVYIGWRTDATKLGLKVDSTEFGYSWPIDISGDAISLGGATRAAFDTAIAARAMIASPTFTGTPSAPTPTAGDNSTKIATTAFVAGVIAGGHTHSVAQVTGLQAALDLKAEIYLGTGTGDVTFPIGHLLVVTLGAGSIVFRNDTPATPIRLDTNNSVDYRMGGAGGLVAGTWRSRGRITIASGENHWMFQRIA